MKIAIRTYAGLEEILQTEIHSITGKNATIQKRAVSIEGNMEDVYKINLWSRFSIDVLVHLHSFKASHENILYKYAHQIEWEKYMNDVLMGMKRVSELSDDRSIGLSSLLYFLIL